MRETDKDRDELVGEFTSTISSLSQGGLTFPPPFDLAASAALADNIDTGEIAQRLFEVTHQRDTAYTISIAAVSSQHPDLPGRPVLETTVASRQLLIVLLEGLLDELTDVPLEND